MHGILLRITTHAGTMADLLQDGLTSNLLERDHAMGILDWKHWVVILVVVVLVFGTKKLKNLGADVGESIKGFRKAMNDDEKGGEPAPASLHQADATDARRTVDGQPRQV